MRWCDERTEINFDGLVGLTHHYAGLSFAMKPLPVKCFRCLARLAAKQGLLAEKLADADFEEW